MSQRGRRLRIIMVLCLAILSSSLEAKEIIEIRVKYCGPKASGKYNTAFSGVTANAPERLTNLLTAGYAADVCPKIALKTIIGKVDLKCDYMHQTLDDCRKVKVFEIHSIE